MPTRLLPAGFTLTLGAAAAAGLIALQRSQSLEWRLTILGGALYAVSLFSCVALLCSGIYLLRREKLTARGIALCALALALVLLSAELEPPRSRVQWDESNLYGTSLSMAFRHNAYMPVLALPGREGPIPVGYNLDKRPPMFPFLVSLLHQAAGPSISNAYAVSLLSLFALLLLVSLQVARRFGWPGGLAAQFLLLATPLASWVASSGLMDFLACTAIFGLVLAALAFRRQPDTSRFFFFLTAGLFASYVRYESFVIFFFLLFASALKARWQASRAELAALAALPLLLTPLFLLLQFGHGSFSVAAGHGLVEPDNFAAHLPIFLRCSFSLGLWGAFNGWLMLLAGGAILLAAWKHALGFPQFLLGAIAALVLTLALSWFQSDARNAAEARLYLLPTEILSTAPLLLLAVVRRRNFPIVLLLASLALWAYGQAKAHSAGRLAPVALGQLYVDEFDELLRDHGSPKTLLVTEHSFYALNHGWAAVTPAYALENAKMIRELVKKTAIDRVLWLRLRLPGTLPEEQSASERLSSAYPWRKLRDRREPAIGELWVMEEGPLRD